MAKSRVCIAGAVVIAAVVGVWSLRHHPAAAPVPPPATLDATIIAGRAQIARVRADIVAKQPPRTIVMPDRPPPSGVPTWATRLPNQAARIAP